MNAKQMKFCDEYMVDSNATQAAIRAGYSEQTAYSQGQRLLKHVEVKNRIAELMDKHQSERVASVQEVLEYLTSVVRGESRSEIVVVEATGDGMSEAKNVEKAPDEKDKLRAAELLGKRYGLYSDKVNVTGSVPVAFVDNLGE